MKKIVLLLLVGVSSLSVYGQKEVTDDSGWSPKERGYLGIGFGGFGLGRSTIYGSYFSIGATPLAGYMLTKNLSAGLAFEYQYTNYTDLKLKIQQYGWYPFARYNIKNFFLQVDYDWYSLPADYTSPEKQRIIANRFFSGIGYMSGGRGRSVFNILLSYDLLYTNTSRFNSPVSLRAFLTF